VNGRGVLGIRQGLLFTPPHGGPASTLEVTVNFTDERGNEISQTTQVPVT